MVDLFDRDLERKQIRAILENEEINEQFAIWIEGIEGAGKTQFLKYLIDKTDLFVFDFADCESIYKCEKINSKNEFAYISSVIFKILKNYPAKYQVFLQDYFDDQNRITFLDAGCLVLPQLKIFSPIKNLFETKYNLIAQSQGNITDKLVNSQLIDFFSDIIIYYFQKLNSDVKHFLFCVDDLQWIDNSSLKTLNSILNKIAKGSYNFKLSLAITTRNSKSLTSDERENYNSAFKVFENCFNKIYTIAINNFDFNTTQQLIVSQKRFFLEENIKKIYEITGGNPLELTQTLRFSDEEVKRILNSYTYPDSMVHKKNYFSQEMVSTLYKENENFLYIVNILSVLGCSISTQAIIKIARIVAVEIYKDDIITLDFINSINILIDREIIKENIDGLSIFHDSMKSLVVEYLRESGEYAQYVKVISNTLLLMEDTLKFSKLKSNIYFALNLLKNVDAKKAFDDFVKIYNDCSKTVTGELFEIGAECFCMDISNYNIETINTIVVGEILPNLFSLGKLQIAKRICDYIYDIRLKLTSDMYVQYLFYYIKILVEMSILVSNENTLTATTLFEELRGVKISNKDTKLQVLILGMSIYEHLLDFNNINNLYNEADELLQSSNNISLMTLAKFYRNKGLVFSHRVLIDDYKKAYKYSCDMNSGAKKQIMKGTTLNNLGLSYFYSGSIKKALACFSSAQKYLEDVGCETSRILNNIALCYYLLGDNTAAFMHISNALSTKIEGNFINTGMKTNYALILYSLGKEERAINILDSVINTYHFADDKCLDEVVYSAAMLNRAYIHINNGEFLDAVKLIKESSIQTYRFDNDLQQKKRTDIINYCLQNENLISNTPIDIDLSNTTMNIFCKPYSLMPFAYYVI